MWSAFYAALRPHQWSKNLLLLVPALVGQAWHQPGVPRALAWAVVAFSLLASGTYLLNDLRDLAADRRHPDKRHRPLAAGRLPPRWAWLGGGGLIGLGLALALTTLNQKTGLMLLVYALASGAYSLGVKRLLLWDVLLLAGLYTLRLLAGGAAAGVAVSSWLLIFALFLFLSLALAKRLTELQAGLGEGGSRAYRATDREALGAAGPVTGLMSVLVLALYVNDAPIRGHYVTPDLLWLLCPLLLYWVLRIWFFALRAELPSDPVVFALRDPMSYGVLAGMLLVFFLATG